MIHDEIQVDGDKTFTDKYYDNAIQIIPTSATYKIYKNSGTEIQSGTASIDSEGTITYTLTAANNDTKDVNFKRVTSYVYNGETIEVAYLFDVVKQPIVLTVNDTDLYSYLPQLRRDIYSLQGETDSTGSLSSLQDNKLKSDDRDFKGGKVEIFVSDTKMHDANITAYSSTTGIVSFDPSYSSTITSGLKYVIRPSYTTQVEKAFYDYVRPLLRKRIGMSASGFIDSQVVNKLVINKALEIICFSKIEETDDAWDIRYKKFKEDFNSEYASFTEAYDYDEDGDISDTEDQSKFGFMTVKVRR
jgi:hypothetical protein